VHGDAIRAAHFAGARIAVATETKHQVWDTAKGELIVEVEAKQAHTSAMALSPDGRWLATADYDGPVWLWDLDAKTARVIVDAGPLSTSAFSHDSKRLAVSTGDRNVYLIDLESGEPDVLAGHTDLILQLAFSPDNATLASASYDKTIRLWDPGTGHSQVLHGHDASADSISFSPDGQLLASGGRDATVRVWDLRSIRNGNRAEIRERLNTLTTAIVGKRDQIVSGQ
jgi:WD40 repeat protein